MDLEMSQLAAFAAVLEEGSFEGAARRLHVTPSAVSQRIKALESRLGQIVVRRSRPVRPTAAGQVLARLAGQVALLEGEALAELATDPDASPLRLPIAVNADSLATWFLSALATLPSELAVRFDLHQEDQDHSAALLRDGTVMAAVTAEPKAVQGCRSQRLGLMRYRAVASAQFQRFHLPHGPTAQAIGRAPMLKFDRKDVLQERFAQMITSATIEPPVSYLPSSTAFVEAARLGLGWGMVPDQLAAAPLATGQLVEIAPGRLLDVSLYWQHWRLDSPILGALTNAVRIAAGAVLA